jgi:hypothetical protein
LQVPRAKRRAKRNQTWRVWWKGKRRRRRKWRTGSREMRVSVRVLREGREEMNLAQVYAKLFVESPN